MGGQVAHGVVPSEGTSAPRAGSNGSRRAGVAPTACSEAARSSVRAIALTSCPALMSSGTTRRPRTPVAPATKTFMTRGCFRRRRSQRTEMSPPVSPAVSPRIAPRLLARRARPRSCWRGPTRPRPTPRSSVVPRAAHCDGDSPKGMSQLGACARASAPRPRRARTVLVARVARCTAAGTAAECPAHHPSTCRHQRAGPELTRHGKIGGDPKNVRPLGIQTSAITDAARPLPVGEVTTNRGRGSCCSRRAYGRAQPRSPPSFRVGPGHDVAGGLGVRTSARRRGAGQIPGQ